MLGERVETLDRHLVEEKADEGQHHLEVYCDPNERSQETYSGYAQTAKNPNYPYGNSMCRVTWFSSVSYWITRPTFANNRKAG